MIAAVAGGSVAIIAGTYALQKTAPEPSGERLAPDLASALADPEFATGEFEIVISSAGPGQPLTVRRDYSPGLSPKGRISALAWAMIPFLDVLMPDRDWRVLVKPGDAFVAVIGRPVPGEPETRGPQAAL